MRVLLSDGSGLTARQTAAQLADAGHRVDLLSPDPLCLARFTRRVHRVWRVPAYGAGPLRWLEAAVRVYREAAMDLLFPTQEQVAVLSACPALLRGAGVRTAVPPFTALARVQDKISANETLAATGLPRPQGAVLVTPEEVTGWDRFPVFMKLPVATASTWVRRLTGGQQLRAFAAEAGAAGAFGDGGVLAAAGGRPAGDGAVRVRGRGTHRLAHLPAGGGGDERRRQPQAQCGSARGPRAPGAARPAAGVARGVVG